MSIPIKYDSRGFSKLHIAAEGSDVNLLTRLLDSCLFLDLNIDHRVSKINSLYVAFEEPFSCQPLEPHELLLTIKDRNQHFSDTLTDYDLCYRPLLTADTALMIAALNGRIDNVRVLLYYGADYNLRNYFANGFNGRMTHTAFDIAMYRAKELESNEKIKLEYLKIALVIICHEIYKLIVLHYDKIKKTLSFLFERLIKNNFLDLKIQERIFGDFAKNYTKLGLAMEFLHIQIMSHQGFREYSNKEKLINFARRELAQKLGALVPFEDYNVSENSNPIPRRLL